MKLRNPFKKRVREFYRGSTCFWCGVSQAVDLHHIFGRESDSIINCAPLCRPCHNKMVHNLEEHAILFEKSIVNAFYRCIADNTMYLEKIDRQFAIHDRFKLGIIRRVYDEFVQGNYIRPDGKSKRLLEVTLSRWVRNDFCYAARQRFQKEHPTTSTGAANFDDQYAHLVASEDNDDFLFS